LLKCLFITLYSVYWLLMYFVKMSIYNFIFRILAFDVFCLLYELFFFGVIYSVYCLLYHVCSIIYHIYCQICPVYCIIYLVYGQMVYILCLKYKVYCMIYHVYYLIYPVYCLLPFILIHFSLDYEYFLFLMKTGPGSIVGALFTVQYKFSCTSSIHCAQLIDVFISHASATPRPAKSFRFLTVSRSLVLYVNRLFVPLLCLNRSGLDHEVSKT